VEAKKAAGAKAVFNARVASYLLGVELVRRRFPQYAPFVRFVRDIQPETLRVPLAQLYETLLAVPEWISTEEARAAFAADPAAWSTTWRMATRPGRSGPSCTARAAPTGAARARSTRWWTWPAVRPACWAPRSPAPAWAAARWC